jgi:tetratricopeptide (TPR) repeat protein
MRWAKWHLLGVVLLAGCMQADQERFRDYNDDGLYQFERGDFQAARDSFLAAQNLRPEDPALFYNLGQCYDRLDDTANAERCYQECLKRSPNLADCRHAQNMLLLRTGRRDEAARQVQEWLTREPGRAAAYAEDGWLAFEAGDLPRAQARLQQALGLDPHEPRALIELARVYEALKRPEQATALYERVLARDPKNFEVTRRLKQLRDQGTGQPLPD